MDHNTAVLHGIYGLTALEARIAERLAPVLAEMGYELVRLAVLGRETPTVQVMADKVDGGLIAVEDCEQISHAVGAVLDVDDPIPGAWMLEVSSPGIDRPMMRLKDWERFAGHQVRVEMDMPLDGRKRFIGIVMGVADEAGVLRLDTGEDVRLKLGEMRKARLVLTDALIEASAILAGVTHAPDSGAGDDTEKRRTPKLNPRRGGKRQ